jgi:hypothetical protein
MNWVTVTDVLNRWREPDDLPTADNILLLTLIEDAHAIIRQAHPSVPTRLDSGMLDITLVKIVVADMVQRAFLRSHDGRISYGSTTGPFSESGAYSDSNASLYLTSEENNKLAGPEAKGKAYSINMDTNRSRYRYANEAGFYNGYYFADGGSVQDDEY